FANEDLGKFFPLRRLRIKAIERTNRGLVLDIRLHHAAVAHNRSFAALPNVATTIRRFRGRNQT
ncbi:MAG TPA: hypothetical protein PKC13_15670, partial [Blastocatellia bacterium]|nr:hypothetical protein [Blastocatellia bacterium]